MSARSHIQDPVHQARGRSQFPFQDLRALSALVDPIAIKSWPRRRDPYQTTSG
jgi:hypothetical protein